VIGKTMYLSPDDKFWQVNAGVDAPAVGARVAGRYIRSSISGGGPGQLAGVCDLTYSVSMLALPGAFSQGESGTRGGVPVARLTQSPGITEYVTQTGKPESVEITSPADLIDGAVRLAVAVGVPVTLAAPPASQVIDAAAADVHSDLPKECLELAFCQ
jgi:hypothetical protein